MALAYHRTGGAKIATGIAADDELGHVDGKCLASYARPADSTIN